MPRLSFVLLVLIFIVCQPMTSKAESTFEESITEGNQALQDERYEEASDAFREAISANPASGEAYGGLGISSYFTGDSEIHTIPEILQEAVKALQRAIDLGYDVPKVRYHLGRAYLALGDKKNALLQQIVLMKSDAALADDLMRRIGGTRDWRPSERVGEETLPVNGYTSPKRECGEGEVRMPNVGCVPKEGAPTGYSGSPEPKDPGPKLNCYRILPAGSGTFYRYCYDRGGNLVTTEMLDETYPLPKLEEAQEPAEPPAELPAGPPEDKPAEEPKK